MSVGHGEALTGEKSENGKCFEKKSSGNKSSELL